MMEEVHSSRPLRVPVRLAGMLKQCTVRMSKPKDPKDVPKPWAILLLDDGESEMEALCFAKTYEKLKEGEEHWLPGAVDTPVLVCGELSHRTDRDTHDELPELQFIAREVYRLSDGLGRFSKALHVAMSRDDPDLLKKGAALKNLATQWPGKVKVVVDLSFSNGSTVQIDSGIPGVALSPEFLLALNRLQKGAPYSLETIKDIFLEPPEPKRWERRPR